MMPYDNTEIYDSDIYNNNVELLKMFEENMTFTQKLILFKRELMFNLSDGNSDNDKRVTIRWVKMKLRDFKYLESPSESEIINALVMKQYLNNKKKKNEKLYRELGIDTCDGDK